MFKRRLITTLAGFCASFLEIEENPSCSLMHNLDLQRHSLSVLPLKDDHNRDSGHFLICNSQHRKLSILDPLTGSYVMNGYRYKKEYLNENLPRLLSQLSATKFLFLECQCFGSSLDDLRMCEHSLVLRDLRDHSILGRLNLSVVDKCKIWANSCGQVVVRIWTPDGHIRCRILDLFFHEGSSTLCSKEFFFEEDADLLYECRKVACFKSGEDLFLIYFLRENEKGAFVGEVALWKVDFDQKGDPPFRKILLTAGSNSIMMPENLQYDFQGPYLFDRDLFFLKYDKPEHKMNFFVMHFDDHDISWKSWTLNDIYINDFDHRSGAFVKNDHQELYWVQGEHVSRYCIYKLGVDGRPSTLKRYAEKTLKNENRSFSSPLLSLNPNDWRFDPKIYTVTVCKLQAKFFDKFCRKILKMADGAAFECEIKLSKSPNKFEIAFNDELSMDYFLNACRREMHENLNTGANWIVEVYDNLCYYDNFPPIFISMPYDFEYA